MLEQRFNLIHLATADLVLHSRTEAEIEDFFSQYLLYSYGAPDKEHERVWGLLRRGTADGVLMRDGEIRHQWCEFVRVPVP